MVAAGFVRGGIVEDRNRHQPAVGAERQPRLVGAPDGLHVAGGAGAGVVGILVVAADVLVQVEELGDGDRAGIESVESVLHADVVIRPQRGAGGRVHAVDVARGIEHRGARPGRIGHRVVAHRVRHGGIPACRLIAVGVLAMRHRIGALRLVGGVHKRLHAREPVDRHLLRLGERTVPGLSEVVQQQVRVESREGDGEGIGERGADVDAVDEAGKRVGHLQAGVCAARSTGADRVRRNTERLDEVLLAHHRRFAGEECVAAVRRVVQRVDEEAVALGQSAVIEHVHAHGTALDIPARRASAAVDGDEPAVPSARRRRRRRRRIDGGIMQHRVLVDAAVHRAGLDPNDEVHDRAGGGLRLRDVGRQDRRIGQRLERLGRVRDACRTVDVLHHRARRAVRVEGSPQLRSIGQRELLRLADERLLPRP